MSSLPDIKPDVIIRLVGSAWGTSASPFSKDEEIPAQTDGDGFITGFREGVQYRASPHGDAWHAIKVRDIGSPVEHPDHYNAVDGMPEVWDVLDAFFPDNPNLWNAGKYLLRTGRKGDAVEQLSKLKQYVDRELERLNAGQD